MATSPWRQRLVERKCMMSHGNSLDEALEALTASCTRSGAFSITFLVMKTVVVFVLGAIAIGDDTLARDAVLRANDELVAMALALFAVPEHTAVPFAIARRLLHAAHWGTAITLEPLVHALPPSRWARHRRITARCAERRDISARFAERRAVSVHP